MSRIMKNKLWIAICFHVALYGHPWDMELIHILSLPEGNEIFRRMRLKNIQKSNFHDSRSNIIVIINRKMIRNISCRTWWTSYIILLLI